MPLLEDHGSQCVLHLEDNASQCMPLLQEYGSQCMYLRGNMAVGANHELTIKQQAVRPALACTMAKLAHTTQSQKTQASSVLAAQPSTALHSCLHALIVQHSSRSLGSASCNGLLAVASESGQNRPVEAASRAKSRAILRGI
jgi:hypothetical protein